MGGRDCDVIAMCTYVCVVICDIVPCCAGAAAKAKAIKRKSDASSSAAKRVKVAAPYEFTQSAFKRSEEGKIKIKKYLGDPYCCNGYRLVVIHARLDA